MTPQPYGTLRMDRRAFFATLAGVFTARPSVMADQPGGFSVVLPCTATDTEKVDQSVNFGKHLFLVVGDTTLWHCTSPLIGQNVRVTLERE